MRRWPAVTASVWPSGVILALGYDKAPEVAPVASGSTCRGGSCWLVGTGRGPVSGRAEGGQGRPARQDEPGPGRVLLQVQDHAAPGAGQGRRDREEAVAQPFGLPSPGLVTGQGEELHPSGVCPLNGVSGVHLQRFSAAGMRSAKVTAKALSAGLHRMVHRAWPVPLGSSPRVTRYRHFSAACSVGK